MESAIARTAPIARLPGRNRSKARAISTSRIWRMPERRSSVCPNIRPIHETAPGSRRASASTAAAMRSSASPRPLSPLSAPSSIRRSTARESMSARPRMLRSCQTVPRKGCAATIRSAVSSRSSSGNSNSPLRRKNGSPCGWNTDRKRSGRRAISCRIQAAARSACSGVAPSITTARSRAWRGNALRSSMLSRRKSSSSESMSAVSELIFTVRAA